MSKKFLSSCAAAILLLCCLSGSASGAPLLLYTSQPDEDVQGLLGAFAARHPEIEVQVFRSGTEEVVSKILAEKMTGRIGADVLLLADAVTFERLKEEDVLERYRSPEAEAIPPSFVDKDETYCGTKMLATVVIYNTAQAQSAAGTWESLTNPEYAGQLIVASPLYSGAAAYMLGVLTRTEGFGWPYYEKLKTNGVAVGQGNGSVITAVAGGEKAYGLVVDYMAMRAKAQGSPVDYAYLAEGSPIITEPIGIVKKADADTGDARRFVDFVLSEAGQKLVSEQGYVPARRGVPVPGGLKGVDEVKALDFDSAVLVKEREQDKTSFSELFGN
jgi:iron(III) transport system substrate-binding protein